MRGGARFQLSSGADSWVSFEPCRAGYGHHPSPDRRRLDLRQSKRVHRRPEVPAVVGDLWVWRAPALPSRLRVLSDSPLLAAVIKGTISSDGIREKPAAG